jgi:hypothetical protein
MGGVPRGVRSVSKKKPPEAIPLERLLLSKGFKRNLDIERRYANRDQNLIDALDKALHDNAAANLHRRDSNRKTAKKAREAKGNETYSTIKAIMGKHSKTAKPREIWPEVRAAIGGTERHFRKVRLKVIEEELKTKQSK